MDRTLDGFSEQGLGTARAEEWLWFFLDGGGWQCSWEGPGQDQPLWPRDAPRPDHEWLLARPGSRTGAIRLYQFPEHVPLARRAAATWDTGGFFDIDLRVQDLRQWHGLLTARGWGGMSDPVDWRFGDLEILEWLARGPDDVVIAFVQRLAPELEPAPPASGFSHAFNASQTVRSMEQSLRFYKTLGFRTIVHHQGPLAGGGGALLGLPEAHVREPVDLAICSPSGVMDGSIELLALPDHPGTDLAARVGPGQRGLNSMRFPTSALEPAAAALTAAGYRIEARAAWDCAPLGKLRGLAVTSPDGAWLELIESAESRGGTIGQ